MSLVNETIHSGSLSYQRCLIPDIPQNVQHTVRDVTNFIVIPLNMLVAFLSLIGNSLVLAAVVRTRSLQHPSLLLLCSLSITDLFWALFSIIRDTVRFSRDDLCPGDSKEEPWFASLCIMATIGNLAIISIDRLLAVSKPWWYRNNVKRSRVIKQASAVWLYSLATSGLLYAKEHSLIPYTVPLVPLMFLYIFCFLLIILSYIGIFIANRSHRHSMSQHGGQILAVLKREKKLANTVGLILIVLVCTYLPALIFPIILSVLGYTKLPPWRPFYGFFITLNGLLNPLLNFGRNADVRRAVRGLIPGPQCSVTVVPRPTVGNETAQNNPSARKVEIELESYAARPS